MTCKFFIPLNYIHLLADLVPLYSYKTCSGIPKWCFFFSFEIVPEKRHCFHSKFIATLNKKQFKDRHCIYTVALYNFSVPSSKLSQRKCWISSSYRKMYLFICHCYVWFLFSQLNENGTIWCGFERFSCIKNGFFFCRFMLKLSLLQFFKFCKEKKKME